MIGTSAGNPDSHTAIGFIIYGKNTLASEDFFNAAITYKFRKRIIQDPAFKILTVITVVWFFFLLNLLLSEDRINEVELLELKDKMLFIEDALNYTNQTVGAFKKQLQRNNEEICPPNCPPEEDIRNQNLDIRNKNQEKRNNNFHERNKKLYK